MNGPIIKTALAQGKNVTFTHGFRHPGQFDRIGAQGPVSFTEGCLPPIAGQLVNKKVGFFIIFKIKISDLGPEVVSVGANSVDTMVFCRYHNGQHLALPST